MPKESPEVADFHGAFVPLVKVLKEVSSVYPKLGNEDLWWRGQSRTGLKLYPKVFRGYSDFDEVNFVHNFRDQAPVRYSEWPTDKTRQLLLMQHYGLPTRLLDWTRDLFTGLYFAVWNKERDNEDGALWALNPVLLNQNQLKKNKVLMSDDKEIELLVNDAFTRTKERDEVPPNVIAYVGPQIDLRMLVQSGVFTIHSPDAPCLQDIPNQGSFVAEIIIPKEHKEPLRTALDMNGFSRRILFPDLGSLAEDLIGRY